MTKVKDNLKEYKYWLHDGTHGEIVADRYEFYPSEKEYVFYIGTQAVYYIPSDWLLKIEQK